MSIRILLADDHQLIRQGVRALLEREHFNVVAEVSNGRDAIDQVTALRPDVAVVDIGMPMLNGVDAAQQIIRASPSTKFVALTMHAEDSYVMSALRAGVRGYVLKTQAGADLIQAVVQVSRGMTYLSAQKLAEAKADFQKVLELAPDGPKAPAAKQVLDQLK